MCIKLILQNGLNARGIPVYLNAAKNSLLLDADYSLYAVVTNTK